MALQLNYSSKIVAVTSPTTGVDAQTLHDFIEDQMASPVGMVSDGGNSSFLGDILKPEGKIEDESNPGVFSQIILVLNPEWQIQFWVGSGYTRIFGGKIVGGVAGQPMKSSGGVGDITVLESPVDGVAIGTSLSESQDLKLKQIHGQVRREIFVDTSLGANGNGYQQSPYSSVTDAIDDAEANGITALVVLSDLSLDRSIKNFTVTGFGTPTISLNGHDIKGSKFISCGLEGTYINPIKAIGCTLLNNSFLNGDFQECILKGDSFCIDGAIVIMERCLSGIAGLGRPSVSMVAGGTCKLSIRAQIGGLDVRDCDQATDEATVEMLPGSVSLATSCVDGAIVVRGVGILADNSAGSSVKDEIVHPLTSVEFSLMAKAVWEYSKTSASVVAGSIGEHVGKRLLTFKKFLGTK